MKTIALHDTGLGTFADGEDGIHAAIAEYGVDTATLRQADGSGMSRFDQATPEAITDLLIGVKQEPWYDTWYDGLPIACTDGTLVSRMCGTPAAGNVHAKTGTQTSVSALSGYVTDADGRELVFSIIINDHLVDSVKHIENQIAVAIASHGADATEAEISRSAEAEAAAEDEAALPGDFECTYREPAVC
jgi:D-alanyl-D-alanine carboxypeptidase/D-alanyl-D-alanine-endopeptidase (penicillin-binding protein 4)